MAIETITPLIEFEFTSGVWTSMADWLDTNSKIQWTRGSGPNRKPSIGTMSFELDNADETWTPGNTASSYYNELRRGIGVRLRSVDGVPTTRNHWRGVVASVKPGGANGLKGSTRVAVQCEGLITLLNRSGGYAMALQTGVTVSAALTAIAAAAGSSLVSITSSTWTLPYVSPRANPLTDMMEVAASEYSSQSLENAAGEFAFKPASSMTGGYGSPAHTWGATIEPETAITVDYRYDSVYSRETLRLSVPQPELDEGVTLYRHPFNKDSGVLEYMPAGSTRLINGVFTTMPYQVDEFFGPGTGLYQTAGKALWSACSNVATSIFVGSGGSPGTAVLSYGDEVLIDSEIMLIKKRLSVPLTGIEEYSVERGLYGTFMTSHVAGAQVFVRDGVVQQVASGASLGVSPLASGASTIYVTPLSTTVMAPGQIFRLTRSDQAIQPGEWMQVTSQGADFGSNQVYNITRNINGLGAQTYTNESGTQPKIWQVVLVNLQPFTSSEVANSYLVGSSDSAGQVVQAGLVGVAQWAGGAHIRVRGNTFQVVISNQSANGLYIADMAIQGSAVKVKTDTQAITYEAPVPNVIGVQDGGGLAMPYGVVGSWNARGACRASLLAGRIPAPWLDVPLMANVSDNTTSVLTAEIGDLVRYTGTGTNREKIDDWFRIVGIEGSIDELDMWNFRFKLRPASDFRRADRIWYTNFGLRLGLGGNPLGMFEIAANGSTGEWGFASGTPANEWEMSSAIDLVLTPDGSGPLETYGYKRLAASSPAIVNVGTADQVVRFKLWDAEPSATSFPVTTGGWGGVFRSTSNASSHWHMFFNKTQSLLYLWNTTDGVVGSAAWTQPSSGRMEGEVRCRGNTIQVYIDCVAEPVLWTLTAGGTATAVTSTRFNTNTYAGIDGVRNSAASGERLRYLEYDAQGL